MVVISGRVFGHDLFFPQTLLYISKSRSILFYQDPMAPFFTFVLLVSQPAHALEVTAGYGQYEPFKLFPVAQTQNHQSLAKCWMLTRLHCDATLSEGQAPRSPTQTNVCNSEKDSKSFSYPHDTLDPGFSPEGRTLDFFPEPSKCGFPFMKLGIYLRYGKS